MTVDTTGGGAVAAYDAEDSIGLEDLDASDVALPRLNIVHKEGVFKSNLSGDVYDTLDVILLGMIRQRIMWHPEVDDGDRPMCKSPDFTHGFPNTSEQQPADKRFPWAESNFDPSMALPVVEGSTKEHPEGFNSNGHAVLPCASCVFNQWGRSPGGKSTPPPCSEQFTFPLLYTPDDGASWLAAILTLQRTGIKPAKQYMSSFVQSKTPLFSTITRLSLTLNRRGSVEYSVPGFARIGATERGAWHGYAEQMTSIRGWLRQAPRGDEDSVVESTPTDNAWTADAAGAAPAPAAPPAAPPAPPAAAAPVAAPPAPPAPAPPAPAPVAAAAPVAPPTPVPAAPSTPATVAPADAAQDDDDIPF